MQRSTTPVGASIVLGLGFVVRNGPLTLVVGGGQAVGRAALDATDALASAAAWSFDDAAVTLQDLVIRYQPTGVAAVLDGAESFAFVFDQAEVRCGDTVVTGQGREGWAVEIVSAPYAEVRLASVPLSGPSTEIELRSGLVPGAGAVVPLVGAVQPVVAPVRTPPMPPMPH